MAAEDIVKEVTDRVREAIEVAEQRAEEIVRRAEAEAERIRAEAETAASRRLSEVQRALDDLQGRLSGASRFEVKPGPVTVPEPAPFDRAYMNALFDYGLRRGRDGKAWSNGDGAILA